MTSRGPALISNRQPEREERKHPAIVMSFNPVSQLNVVWLRWSTSENKIVCLNKLITIAALKLSDAHVFLAYPFLKAFMYYKIANPNTSPSVLQISIKTPRAV